MNRRPLHPARRSRGFTLIEVMVALLIVAIGLAALMITVSSTARTSGFLRDKTVAQWIALNRLTEVRLNLNKFAANTDTGELNFANRTWHYDTRYFDTSIGTMKRVVVRVYAGDAKTKGNPLAESTGFLGSSVATAGGSNAVDWTMGTTGTPVTPNGITSPNGTVSPNGAVSPGSATQVPVPTTTPAPTSE
ncbi:MAG: type II secretion system minor pseudopilin GspI [Steroidobacteraceae bacterium]